MQSETSYAVASVDGADQPSFDSRALIGPGVTVGEGALVAPRSAVAPGTRIPAGEFWAGNPARFIGDVDALTTGL
jgi:acetyltransferase-like isoleucine patch superfamily enzyme